MKMLWMGLALTALVSVAGLAQGAVVLPPADEEVAALEEAFAHITAFFKALITDFRVSLTTLNEKVAGLERATVVLRASLAQLTERQEKFEASVIPVLRDHEGRLAAIERHDLESLQRRLLALDQAVQGLQLKVDHNRAKIEGLETALAALNDRLTAEVEAMQNMVLSVKENTAAYEDALSTLTSRVETLEKQQAAMWPAIILVPLLVGGLVFLLLSAQ